MAIHVLSLASALNPGADLWVIPDHQKSQWTARLDWYLNFQIVRGTRKASPQLPGELASIQQQADLPLMPTQLPSSLEGLLIPADQTLPARWIYCLPFSSIEEWVSTIEKTWMGLNQPTLKVFLPTGLTAGQFSENWQKVAVPSDLSVVLD